MKENKIIAAIVGSYLVGFLYDIIELESETKRSFFPFFTGYNGWDGKVTLSVYVYFYCEGVSRALIMYAAYVASGFRLFALMVWLEIADLINYALFYSHTIFHIFGYSVEFNHIKFVIIFSAAIWEHHGHRNRSL